MTFTTSGAIAFKAGKNVSSSITEADWNRLITESETFICTATRANYSGAYATLPGQYKSILGDVASSFGAVRAISFDMSGYTSRGEAENMININHDIVQRGIKILEESKTKETLGVT